MKMHRPLHSATGLGAGSDLPRSYGGGPPFLLRPPATLLYDSFLICSAR